MKPRLVCLRRGASPSHLLAAAVVAAAAQLAEVRVAIAGPPDDDVLARGPLARDSLVATVLARHPALAAARARARAGHIDADAEGRLPSPEVMVELWQVPLARPYALDQAGMLMVGVRQRIPSPGSLGAREAAREASARAADIGVEARGRDLAREAGHAFTDHAEAYERLARHREHHDVAAKLVEIARARHAAGGRLTDVTQMEAELAMVASDLATDEEQVTATRARLNTLLARAPGAPLAEPTLQEPAVTQWELERLLAEARLRRPETRMARAERDGADASARAAREATVLRSASVCSTFAPVAPMPMHGYGASLSAELPWLWGANSRRAEARRQELEAARSDEASVALRSDADIAAAFAAQRTSARKLGVLSEQVRPTSRRALEAAWSGYATGQTDLLTILAARRAVLETDVAIVTARAALEHALTELEWAAGTPVPRRPLSQESRGVR